MAEHDQNEDQDQPDSEGIKQLREQAKQTADLQKQVDAQKRELAFAKAGVDTESKLGKMLFQTFEGDLSADAIQAEAKEIGLLRTEADASTQQTSVSTEDRQQTDQRQSLAAGSLDDGTQGQKSTVDPQLQGITETRARLKDGEAPESAFQSYVQNVVDAAVAEDPRVILGTN